MDEHLTAIEQALRDIEQHHVHLNGQAGREESKSYTLSRVRAGLAAVKSLREASSSERRTSTAGRRNDGYDPLWTGDYEG